jgi:hypothetical protein
MNTAFWRFFVELVIVIIAYRRGARRSSPSAQAPKHHDLVTKRRLAAQLFFLGRMPFSGAGTSLHTGWRACGDALWCAVVQCVGFGAKFFQAAQFVHVLAAFLARLCHQAARLVEQPHACFDFVLILSAFAACTKSLDGALPQQRVVVGWKADEC